MLSLNMETVNVESELKIRPEEFEILYGQSLDKEIEVEDPSLIVKRQTEH